VNLPPLAGRLVGKKKARYKKMVGFFRASLSSLLFFLQHLVLLIFMSQDEKENESYLLKNQRGRCD
jgi:hypothetical protein